MLKRFLHEERGISGFPVDDASDLSQITSKFPNGKDLNSVSLAIAQLRQNKTFNFLFPTNVSDNQ